MNNIVLVHGGFVDGSGWEGVYRKLTKDGYNVSIVQNPTLSLADDVAVTKRVLAAQAFINRHDTFPFNCQRTFRAGHAPLQRHRRDSRKCRCRLPGR